MIYGTGDFSYELAEDWGSLPEGYEFHQVAGVGVDSHDDVYLFNRSSHQLMVFNNDGDFLKSWNQSFLGPHGMCIGPDDNVYLVDRDAHIVLKYDLDERLLLTLGTRGQPSDTGYAGDLALVDRPGSPFHLPSGVAITDAGDIFVSDGYGNCRVHHYDPTGALIDSWGGPGKSNPGDFHLPHGIGIDLAGRVIVCDRENNRLQIFNQDGEIQGIWTGLRQPTDVVVGPEGETYVSELGHRISILDTEGNVLARWGEKSSDKPGQFVAPHGISINSRGDLYVGEVLEGRRIQKFIRRR